MQVGAAAETNQWTLRTADTEIGVGVSGNQPVVSRLACTGQQHNWAARPMAVGLMAKVWVGQREVPTAWTFRHGQMDEAAGKLTLVFDNADPKLQLRSVWRARPGHGPVEHWMEIENTSGGRVTVAHQDSLDLGALHPGGAAGLWWVKRGGGNAVLQGGTFTKPLTESLSLQLPTSPINGVDPVPWMAVQVGEDRGLYVGWEFSAQGRIHARSAKDGTELEVRVGNRVDFKTDVEPGETFLVPPAFVGCYNGDVDEGSYCLHRFFIEKLRPRVPKGCPDPILAYNTIRDCGFTNATEATVMRVAKLAHQLGFEVFVPDAMWYPQVGDWRWDPKRFPNGSVPIVDFVHSAGMRMGLWCAWTDGGVSDHPDALSVRRHAEWFNTGYPPDWKPAAFNGGRMCLACRPATEWVLRTTRRVVVRDKLQYFKVDGHPIMEDCSKKTHRHRYGVDASYWATLGYYEVQEALLRAFPNLILENCSGGGRIKDYGAMRRTHYIVATDTLSALPNRQSIYDSTFASDLIFIQDAAAGTPKAFKADVGLDDASGGGSVQFQVLADGKIIAESPIVKPRTVHRLSADVPGAKQVTLRVLNGGDGHSCDHAAWGWPRFLKAGTDDPVR